MTLFWPVNSDAVAAGGTFLYDRGPKHVPRYHQGVDARVPVGTPIYGSGDGVVTGVFNTGTSAGFGLYVQVQYGTLQVRTAHMSSVEVAAGQKVTLSTRLGYSGGAKGAFGAGDSTGPHCHVETHVGGTLTDPHAWLAPRSQIAGGGATPITPRKKAKRNMYVYKGSGDTLFMPVVGPDARNGIKGLTSDQWAVLVSDGYIIIQVTDAFLSDFIQL